jgi:hypothetical protein
MEVDPITLTREDLEIGGGRTLYLYTFDITD